MAFPKLDYITHEENLDHIKQAKLVSQKCLGQLKKKENQLGSKLLIQRIEDLLYFLEFRQMVKTGKKFDLDLSRIDHPIPPLNTIVDPKIEKIEKEMNLCFTESDFLDDSDKKKARIFAYLMTRGHLSSTKLCKLTEISLPTVNKKLRELTKERFIQPNLTKDGYVLKSTVISFSLFRHYYYEQLIGWIPRMQEIQDQLRDPKQRLAFLKGYPEIYTLIDRILYDLKELKSWFDKGAAQRKEIMSINALKR